MLTVCNTLAFVTGWKVRLPLRLLVLFCVGLLFGALFFLTSSEIALGQGIGTEHAKNNTDSTAIPWSSLDERSKRLIREVIDNKTFLRHLPRQVGYCDPEMYDFMISHPDVVVELWELLGVTQISLKETGPNKYLLKEGTATSSQVEVLYKSESLCIVYGSGEYEATLGPLVRRKINGDVILILKSRYGWDKENRPIVQSDLDAYVRIHNPGAEMLAKILLPVVGKIADSNFEQTVGFVMNISDAAQEDFDPLLEFAQRMDNVRPEVAEEFALVAEATFDREVDRYVALATASQQPLGKLVYPSTSPAAVEASTIPKYATQPGQVVAVQDQPFPSNNLRLSAVSTSTDPFDETLIPPSASEIRRNTSSQMFEADDSSDSMDLDALMHSLQEPVGQPGVILPSEFEFPAQRPRTLTIVNDSRSINASPPQANTQIQSPLPTMHGTSPVLQQPTDRDRVMISTITPSSSSAISRTTTQQPDMSTSAAVTPVPSPTRFGTTTPILPRPLGTLRFQSDARQP